MATPALGSTFVYLWPGEDVFPQADPSVLTHSIQDVIPQADPQCIDAQHTEC